MQLYYTPKSHFSRKVRLLLAALRLDVKLLDVGNVANASVAVFGQNPLMKVPALVDQGRLVFESDHIAQYLVQNYDPQDQFNVLTADYTQLNARAVLNGIMANEVELILAARSGLDINSQGRFCKIRQAITNGLDWLEYHSECISIQPSYLGFHLVSMYDHLDLYKLVPLHHLALRERVASLSVIPFVAASAPE